MHWMHTRAVVVKESAEIGKSSLVMWTSVIATICSGVFAGAAIYVNAVERPPGSPAAQRWRFENSGQATVGRPSCRHALRLWAASRAYWSAWEGSDGWLALGAILLGAVVPFTLLVILPTNHRLLDTALDPRSQEATQPLVLWGRLHAVRSALSSAAFLLFVVRLARR